MEPEAAFLTSFQVLAAAAGPIATFWESPAVTPSYARVAEKKDQMLERPQDRPEDWIDAALLLSADEMQSNIIHSKEHRFIPNWHKTPHSKFASVLCALT